MKNVELDLPDMETWGMLATLGFAASMTSTLFRPPAVPLIAHDPYFSIWSFSDKLTDSWTRHWTGSTMAMCGMVRIDGKTYRFAGNPPGDVPALEQTGLQVMPTTTHYTFEGGGIRLHVRFTSPTFADDLDVLSYPVGFVRLSYENLSGTHTVQAYFDTSGEWCVNKPDQRVNWGRVKMGGLEALRMGSQEQHILNRSGDDLRIDWGNMYMVPPAGAKAALAADDICRGDFNSRGDLPSSDDLRMPRSADDSWPLMATAFSLSEGRESSILLAYDDIESLEWFKRPVPEYWRRNGMTFQDLIHKAVDSAPAWFAKAAALDEKLRGELEAKGGEKYAELACLSYRQAFAAHKIVADIDGKPMMFSKENFSNGCIGTVDVLYPAAPIMLWLNPELLEANLRPLFEYASLPRWRWPFAPHDLGQYPLANGQVYGGGERTEENQMPVEECGNLLILAAAHAKWAKSTAFAAQYEPILDKWANYLMEKGLDPENQLCTDDFAGHLAHNANLSVKAIVALGSYAQLLDELGGSARKAHAAKVRGAAEQMAKEWMKLADDGDHYRLAFDKPGTWSQKYNLVWDKLLGLKLFPKSVYEKELAYYGKMMGKFGLPLDNRKAYTKLDWCVWTATLAGSRAEFEKHISPLWEMANESSSRVPLTDWYWVTDGKQVGFQARSVVGGVFIPMLGR